MTNEQALEEAIRRWGPHACTQRALVCFEDQTPTEQQLKDFRPNFRVSCGHWDRGDGPCTDHYGEGKTWEEAFANADKRALVITGKS